MKIAAEWRVDQLNDFGDSQLIINQVNDVYQKKDEKFLPYKCMVDDMKYFSHITFQQVPRENNKVADAMATLASLLKIPENDLRHEFLVEKLLYPTHDTPESRMICSIVGHDSSCYHHIYSYLHDQTIPDSLTQNKKGHLIRNASWYVIIAEELFRRGLNRTLLRCLEFEESKHALVDIHKGICGSHSNGLTLARKLIRASY